MPNLKLALEHTFALLGGKIIQHGRLARITHRRRKCSQTQSASKITIGMHQLQATQDGGMSSPLLYAWQRSVQLLITMFSVTKDSQSAVNACLLVSVATMTSEFLTSSLDMR
jgi:hypothetical protein